MRVLSYIKSETPKLSSLYRDPFVKLSDNDLTSTGFKGWATVLLTHGATLGCWYFETTVCSDDTYWQSSSSNLVDSFCGWNTSLLKTQPHVRVGWSSRYARFDEPIGTNQFGVSLRDVDGSVCFNKHRLSYADIPIESKSVIGCGLILGPCDIRLPDPRLKPELHPFLENGLLCDPLHPPQPSTHSLAKIQYSINGKEFKCLPLDLPAVMYHPGISLYMKAKCQINIGPEFVYPVPNLASDIQKITGFDSYRAACYLETPEI
ncbi:set1/Ash2 histone methyltransferase complex subunit ASH2-like [Hylaeus volcanicus]|uniref:set1/Ash2 histone methyltransferase complex subunit ASH2-like n=1 Tax=Hylaeus volcanicus TaxID=313075 RepID=UPI0023B7D7CC|nr:set1/Ash2 histone methyltransferase complex subunit ASH2-like [Hylaeus volcanicus]